MKTNLPYLHFLTAFTMFLVTVGKAQDNWEQLNPPTHPTAFYAHSMAYVGDDKVAMFGGGDLTFNGDQLNWFNEIWVYDLSDDSWTLQIPPSSPSDRAFHAIANIENDNVLLFGGRNEDNSENDDTWVYDLSENTWTLMSPSTHPSAQENHMLASLPGDQVLFLGFDNPNVVTWVYDLSDNTWTQKNPTPSFGWSPDILAPIGTDQVLLFGNSYPNGETWLYDLSEDSWNQLTPIGSPGNRDYPTMTSLGNDRVLLFGGSSNENYFNDETWLFDLSDNTWSPINPSDHPSGRFNTAMEYIDENQIILFGGIDVDFYNNETWLYTASAETCSAELCNGIDDNCDGLIDNKNVLNFDGVDDHVEMNSFIVPTSGDFTVEFWIQSSIISEWKEFISQGSAGDAFYIGTYYGSAMIRCGDLWQNTGAFLPLNQWVHVAMTKSGTDATLFLDGEQVAFTTGYSISAGGTYTRLGRQYGSYDEFPVAGMDELRIWNIARTQSEIQSNMNISLEAQAGLVANYHFDQGVAGGDNTAIAQIMDDSGNNNHGTLINFSKSGVTSNFVTGMNGAWTWYEDADNDGYGNPSVFQTSCTGAPSGYVSNGEDCNDIANTIHPYISDECNGIDDNCDALIDNSNALNFDGINDHVSATLPMTVTDNFTIEAWIKPTDFVGVGIPVSYGFDDGYSGNGVSLYLEGSNLKILFSGVEIFSTGFVFPAPDQWYHTALVRSGGTTRAYINGVQAPNTSTTIPSVPTSFNIGSQNGVRFFEGTIDEVRLWNIVRTQTEIQANMNIPLQAQAGLVANYHFDQGMANGTNTIVAQVMDDSGNNNHGTLTDFSKTGTTSNFVAGVNSGSTWYEDADNDGYGNPSVSQTSCTGAPSGYVDNDNDCDDGDDAINPDALEICNGLDDNCDGLMDADDPTVMDTEAPAITCLNDVSVSNDVGTCQANVSIQTPTVSDNCVGASTALRFDGSLQYVDPQTFPSVSNNFTMEMWVNPTATHEIDGQSTGSVDGVSGQRYALWPTHGFGWNGGDAGVGISVGTNGISVYEHADSYMPPLLVYEAPIVGWTHFSVVYINKQPFLYINGSLVATGLTSPRPNIHPSAGNGWSYPGQEGGIGGGSYGNFIGDIDEVRIWNYSRSQSEIQSDYLTHLTGTESGLFLYYDFEDGTGSATADDASPDNRTGYLINMDPATDWIQPGSSVSSSIVLQNDFNNSDNASGLYPLGSTLVTWTATDVAGNSATCSFTVIVNDTEAPVFSAECPSSIEDVVEEGQWGAHISWTAPIASDNCAMESITSSHSPGDFFNVGTTLVVYTAIDEAGNSSTCTFEVNVTPPEILSDVNLSIFANDIQFSNANPAPGTFINVNATVHNNSNVATTNFVCHLMNQYTNTSYPDITISSLDANQSTIVTWNIQTPAMPAFVPMQVTIDYLNSVVESNELDNQAIRPFVNGLLPFSGQIVVNAGAIPSTAIAGSGISICGNAYYADTAIPLIDSSVAGAQVTMTIAETGQLLNGVTNSNGDFCIIYYTPNTAGLYHFNAAVTDFTLTGDTTGTFELTPPPVEYCPTDLSISMELFGSFLCGNLYHIVQGSSLTGIVRVTNSCQAISIPTTLYMALPDGTPVPGPYLIPALSPGETYSLALPEMTFDVIGPTYISGTVDFFNAIAEDIETNNSRSISIQVHPPLPDIVPVQGYVSSHFQCTPSSVSFRIYNLGGVPTDAFNTVLDIYRGNTLEASFTQTVNSIPALCYDDVAFVFNPQFSGAYHFNLYCDTVPNVVTELSEFNNSLSMTHYYQACNLDLVVHGCGSMDVKPTNPVSSGMITVYASIGNYGQLPVAAPFVVNFDVAGTIYPVAVNQPIPANGAINVSVTVPKPLFGNNDLLVEADADDTVTELDESNNTASGKLCWDFMLTNTKCHGGNPFRSTQFICNPIQLTIDVLNQGLYEASNLQVKFEVSGPGLEGWINLGSAAIFIDNSCGCPLDISLPSSFLFPQTGTYLVRMTADAPNLYVECFEDNNQLILPVSVVENADYAVYSQFIAPSDLNPDLNEPVTFNLTYKNEGCTGLSPIELYMQMDNTPHDSVPANALDYNATNTYSMSQSWSSALPGVHVIRSVIDHDQFIAEGNELNNEATRSIIVGGAPNFNLYALESSNTSPSIGETITLTASVINEGETGADGTLQFYFVNAQGLEILIDQQFIHLAEGETLVRSVSWFVTYQHAMIVARISNVDPLEYDFTDNERQLQLNNLAVVISSQDVACNGLALGILETIVTGGKPPYFIQWSNGYTGDSINVPVGIYSVLVTDVNGLQVTAEDTVNALAIPATWYADVDHDGYGNGDSSLLSCTSPEGYVMNTEDCDDTDASIHPMATEVCDTQDNDCDGLIDDADTSVVGQALWYRDFDEDNYGNPDLFLLACFQPNGYVGTGTDCDDNDAGKHPDGNEVLDGKDNDCDGMIDEGLSVISVDIGDCMVVYHGYSPTECAVLNANVQGGSQPYTYTWSNGAHTASTIVCPAVTTIYEVTVTDHNGHTAQDVVTVQVIDIRCGNNNNKVLVCHLPPGNPENVQMICIAPSAVQAHLDHGCFLGVCESVNPCDEEFDATAINPVIHDLIVEESMYSLLDLEPGSDEVKSEVLPLFTLFPNPADQEITIHLSNLNTMLGMRLYDLSGKLVLDFQELKDHQTINTATLYNGIYFLSLKTTNGVIAKRVVILH